jgi:hypothetical protein
MALFMLEILIVTITIMQTHPHPPFTLNYCVDLYPTSVLPLERGGGKSL